MRIGPVSLGEYMSLFSLLKEYIEQDKGVILATVVRGPEGLLGTKALIPVEGEPIGPLLETPLRDRILQDVDDVMKQRASVTRHYPLSLVHEKVPPPVRGEGKEGEEVEVFFDVYPSASRLIIVGAVHIASELIHFAKRFGFHTYVIDPRSAFATRERFAHADYLLQQWPDEALPEIGLTSETSVVVLTHDPKLDDLALKLALPSPAGYVGALGNPKTHARRVKRLLAEGVAQEHIDRLHAPIGLNLGGRSPAEIALSIMAEIVAVRNGRSIANHK
jgi:xanthine dehydrogenase accessory factor